MPTTALVMTTSLSFIGLTSKRISNKGRCPDEQTNYLQKLRVYLQKSILINPGFKHRNSKGNGLSNC